MYGSMVVRWAAWSHARAGNERQGGGDARHRASIKLASWQRRFAPARVRDAAHPIELRYCVGIWDLAWSQGRRLFVLDSYFNQCAMMRLH